MSEYLRNRPFLVIKISQVPAPGQNTSSKDFGKTGQMVGQENIKLVDRVSPNDQTEADVILDILEQKVIKAREVPEEYQDKVLAGYIEKYQDKIRGYIEFWLTKDPKNLETLKAVVARQEEGLDPEDILKTDIEEIMNGFIFDENIPTVREKIVKTLSTYLLVRAESGMVFDYMVQCDEENNPEEAVREGLLHVDIALKFTEDQEEYTIIPVVMAPPSE